ncbi:MAG: type II toxin-antitoxin system RelE/ParE family toxin [Streptococcaceae bacterium]|jgi:phage-related protein|nr:type II toxin-antitoxin system RelE/ParE family toxin [Streptococcaceae bacterium]
MNKPEFDWDDEFGNFLISLPKKDRAVLLDLIDRVETVGLVSAGKVGWVKSITNEKNLYELRSKLGSNIQRGFYFNVEKETYFITHGFTKKTQKTPSREIEKAKRIRNRYLEDKQNGKI